MEKHTVAFLLLDVAVIIAAARIGGRIARAFRQPPVIGEMAIGIALGPSLFGLLPGAPDEWLFPTDVRPLLGALAQIGLVLFMFIVGLELDLRITRGRERAAGSISIASIVLPFVLGAGLGVLIYPSHDVVGGEQISKLGLSLFLGIAMSITAFPILARILTDRGMQRTVPGVFSLAAAAIDDIVAWTLLALVIAIITGGSPLAIARIVGLTLVYAAVMFLVVRPLLRKLVAWRDAAGRLTPDILAVILVGLFLSSAATDVIGIHQIFGAFVFGAVMPRVGAGALTRDIFERLEQVSVLLLLPMFFVVTGLTVDIAGIGGTGWWQLILVLIVAMSGKFVGAYFGARVSGIPQRQSAAISVLMNTRGLTELVILTAGRELGVLSDDLFAMMVIMALVTTIMAEPLLRLIYPQSVVSEDIAAAERLALAGGPSRRSLVVIDDLDGTLDEIVTRHRRRFAATAGADVVLAGVIVSDDDRGKPLELGAPVVPDLAAMASAVEKLTALGAKAFPDQSVSVICRFTSDPAADLAEIAANVAADVVIVAEESANFAAATTVAPVLVVDESRLPGAAGRATTADTAIVCVSTDSRDGRTALVLAAGLALNGSRRLTVVTAIPRRRVLADLGPVIGRGVEVDVVDISRGADAARDGITLVPADVTTPPRTARLRVVDPTLTSEDAVSARITARFGQADTPASDQHPGAPDQPTASRPEGH
ncbi:cation:proton antiporter [Gordonia soli]|uniref:Putative Na(+)/H(+) antiporter n=1 Tax=Gordonia soli NBRC 108243 TaxID=1223545 RepID=M0QJM2_9ACTN|nr:cation:proton antiporter [Gordonia soli]GAC68654.1 putative Na(+)/H(+) antiporter [Gordonia soli NBRC 108243]